MSFIDKTEIVEAYTDASLLSLEKALREFGYDVSRSRISVTATLKTFSGYNSTILMLDQNGIRYCKDTESSKGLLLNPKTERLLEIVHRAESIEKHSY